MRHDEVPKNRLKSFRVRSHRFGIHRWNDHASIGNRCRKAAVAANNSADLGANTLCVLKGAHQIQADISLQIAAADRKYEHKVVLKKSANLQPLRKNAIPSVVVGSRGQLGNIVGWCVGFYAADLSEVIDNMGAVCRAASHAKQDCRR